MPWIVRQNGNGQWEVLKKGTKKVVGTHSSQSKAMAQMKALYANVKE